MTATATYLGLVQWEWFRLRQRVGFWVVVGISGLFVVGILAVTTLATSQSAVPLGIPPQGYPAAVFQGLSRLGPFFGIVLASFLLGSEFAWGTWRTLIARGERRHWTIHSKLLLGSGILLAVWVVAWCVGAGVGLIAGDESSSAIGDFLFDVPDGWGEAAATCFASLPVAMTYMALGALPFVASRSSAFGVGVGLAVVVAESVAYPLANVIVNGVYGFELHEYTRWTLWGVSNGIVGRDEMNAAWFLPAVLAYLIAFYGLSVLVFGKRDVDSGSG